MISTKYTVLHPTLQIRIMTDSIAVHDYFTNIGWTTLDFPEGAYVGVSVVETEGSWVTQMLELVTKVPGILMIPKTLRERTYMLATFATADPRRTVQSGDRVFYPIKSYKGDGGNDRSSGMDDITYVVKSILEQVDRMTGSVKSRAREVIVHKPSLFFNLAGNTEEEYSEVYAAFEDTIRNWANHEEVYISFDHKDDGDKTLYLAKNPSRFLSTTHITEDAIWILMELLTHTKNNGSLFIGRGKEFIWLSNRPGSTDRVYGTKEVAELLPAIKAMSPTGIYGREIA